MDHGEVFEGLSMSNFPWKKIAWGVCLVINANLFEKKLSPTL